MKIPSEFQLGGTTWTVTQVKSIPGAMGQCVMQEANIQILSTLPKQVKEQTLCHEVVHSILFAMGKQGETHDEVFVDGFATFLHQYLNSAK